MEAAIRGGMIPVNSNYTKLFAHAPLAMRIMDRAGNTALSSSRELRRDDNTLQFTAPIAGGAVHWQEDISALNRLHREVGVSVRRLTAANALLAERERVKRAVDEKDTKTQIMSQLEAEIAVHTARLSDMIGNSESAARIVLLLCYIKRRCNLFFREREAGEESLPADELTGYFNELAELACYADVKIITTNQMTAPVGLRRATLFCDFFYSAVDWAAGCACSSMLAHLGGPAHLGPGQTLRLLLSEGTSVFRMEEGLAAAISSAGGAVTVRDLDDSVGISLTFPEGGELPGN
jgi:hypothetical protein